jgi:hypothetical protein
MDPAVEGKKYRNFKQTQGKKMKYLTSLFLFILTAATFPLCAADTLDAANDISRGGEYREDGFDNGEYREDSLENREDRSGERGEDTREQNLDDRQQNLENRESDRPY